MSDFWVILWCIIYGIAWLICFPITIYHTIHFWKLRNMDIIKKRRPALVLTVSVLYMTHLIGMYISVSDIYCNSVYIFYLCLYVVFRPVSSSLHVLPIYPENSIFKEPYFQTVYSYQLLFVVYFYQLRLWFIYYDLRKANHLISLKYQSQLKFKQYKHNLPWTLRYNKTLGNITFMTVVTLIISFSLATTMVILAYFGIETVFNLILPLFTLIWLIPLSIVAAKLKDEIGIGREIRAICIFAGVFIAFYVVGSFLLPNDTLGKPRNCFMFFLWGPLLMIPFLRSLHIPSLKLKNEKFLTEILHIYSCKKVNMDAKQIDSVITENEEIKLNDILRNRNAFNAFVNHCMNEFSSENILYLIELYDLKCILIKNDIININNIEMDHDIWEMIMNKTCIIKDENKKNTSVSMKVMKPKPKNNILDECREHLLYLYDEYISSDAVSIINISNKERKKLGDATQKLNDESTMNDNEYQCSIICDTFLVHMSCGKSVYNLLRSDTWMRFKQTNQYKILSDSIVT